MNERMEEMGNGEKEIERSKMEVKKVKSYNKEEWERRIN